MAEWDGPLPRILLKHKRRLEDLKDTKPNLYSIQGGDPQEHEKADPKVKGHRMLKRESR